MPRRPESPLGPLENAVMQIVWTRKQATAEEVRVELGDQQHKESTVRTILTRLESKGYLTHEVEGRTYVYRPRIHPSHVATRQVRGIIDRLCRGSVENLLVGMVDDDLITPEKLREMADRIANSEREEQADPAEKMKQKPPRKKK